MKRGTTENRRWILMGLSFAIAAVLLALLSGLFELVPGAVRLATVCATVFGFVAAVTLLAPMWRAYLGDDLERRIPEQLQRRISEQVGLARESFRLGLVESADDATRCDYSDLFQQSERLIVVLNDGRTWMSVHREDLRKRCADASKETTIFLIHPDSPMIDVLARKGSTEVVTLRGKIAESVSIVRDIRQPFSRIEVLGHYLFNPHSIVLGDTSAIVVPYFVSRGGRVNPALKFTDLGRDCYFRDLAADLEKLRIDADALLTAPTSVTQARLRRA